MEWNPPQKPSLIPFRSGSPSHWVLNNRNHPSNFPRNRWISTTGPERFSLSSITPDENDLSVSLARKDTDGRRVEGDHPFLSLITILKWALSSLKKQQQRNVGVDVPPQGW
ncbi:hypothetical protein TNIN_89401 [Trichonephila inaurata madagascariensis]|uniref:Uncharacterized protein n=1 Tax=Trichonephila inaurata madagascariensis TaxID=2747483 RepID=A0A8X6Y6J5_9ARAC|nr:hypothetical protein TNIN_89401 [Trichonephila inaurata madagascariensis]